MRFPRLPSSLTVVGFAALLGVSPPMVVVSHAAIAQGEVGQDAPLTRADYGAVFGIAHRGGRSLDNAERVIAAGADIVEIDVRVHDSRLVSSHDPVIRMAGVDLRPAPTLDDIWPALDGTDAVLLDLKETTTLALSLLQQFLMAHRGEHVVAISTPDVAVLDSLATIALDLVLLQTVKESVELAAAIEAGPQCGRRAGVSIDERLVTADTTAQLHAAGLMVIAWTVNDRSRVAELVGMGVDGIVTDSAAILALLGGAQDGERALPSQPLTGAPSAACSAILLPGQVRRNRRSRNVPWRQDSKVRREGLDRTGDATDRHAPRWARASSSRCWKDRDF